MTRAAERFTGRRLAGMAADCLFCSIVAGDVTATVLADTDEVLAFADVNPQAPLHALVIPKAHEPNAAASADADPGVLSALVGLARQVAADAGHEDYRLVFNTGAESGQTVFHTHLHVLAGRPFTWPPG